MTSTVSRPVGAPPLPLDVEAIRADFPILSGTMNFDGGDGPTTLAEYDSAVIDAGQVYGFVVGDDGVEFLLVRTALATSQLAT